MKQLGYMRYAGHIYLSSALAIERELAILRITCTAPANTYLSKTFGKTT
jgi:hypothetical protein